MKVNAASTVFVWVCGRVGLKTSEFGSSERDAMCHRHHLGLVANNTNMVQSGMKENLSGTYI